MKIVNTVATALLVVGGLNWGLYVFDINLVNMIFGSISILEYVVYVLVALSAVVVLVNLFRMCACKCDKCNSAGCQCSK